MKRRWLKLLRFNPTELTPDNYAEYSRRRYNLFTAEVWSNFLPRYSDIWITGDWVVTSGIDWKICSKARQFWKQFKSTYGLGLFEVLYGHRSRRTIYGIINPLTGKMLNLNYRIGTGLTVRECLRKEGYELQEVFDGGSFCNPIADDDYEQCLNLLGALRKKHNEDLVFIEAYPDRYTKWIPKNFTPLAITVTETVANPDPALVN